MDVSKTRPSGDYPSRPLSEEFQKQARELSQKFACRFLQQSGKAFKETHAKERKFAKLVQSDPKVLPFTEKLCRKVA